MAAVQLQLALCRKTFTNTDELLVNSPVTTPFITCNSSKLSNNHLLTYLLMVTASSNIQWLYYLQGNVPDDEKSAGLTTGPVTSKRQSAITQLLQTESSICSIYSPSIHAWQMRSETITYGFCVTAVVTQKSELLKTVGARLSQAGHPSCHPTNIIKALLWKITYAHIYMMSLLIYLYYILKTASNLLNVV